MRYRIGRRNWATIVSRCEEALATLRVNAENIERVLQDQLLPSQRTILDALLAAPLRIQVEQIEAGLRYLTITQMRAERVLQGIGTMTECVQRVGKGLSRSCLARSFGSASLKCSRK